MIIKEYYLRCVWAHLDWQAAEQTDLGAGPPAKIIQETDKNPVRKSIADNGLHKNRTRRPKAAPKSQTDGQLEQPTQREGILPQLSEPELEILQPVAEGAPKLAWRSNADAKAWYHYLHGTVAYSL